METKKNRREALQQIGLITVALGFFPFLQSCTNPADKKTESAIKKNKTMQPFLIPKEKPLEIGAFGGDVRTIIHSKNTGGQFSCVETVLAPKKMAGSPHKHDELDELMYVLEGTATVLVGNDVVEVPAGSWHLRPRGVVHAVWNGGDIPFRLLDMYFNQNFEDYLDELFHKIYPEVFRRGLSFDDPQIKKRLDELNSEFGLTYYDEMYEPLIKKYGLS